MQMQMDFSPTFEASLQQGSGWPSGDFSSVTVGLALVSSTFQHLYVDGSILPLIIGSCNINGIQQMSNYC